MAKKANIIFLLLILIGGWLRAIDLWRGVDGTVRESWRECDIAAVARNFYQEDMNILYPRIDWRGNGPGYAEMEFPVFPWMIALGYKVFGFHEVIGRVLAFIFSLATLFAFFKLARYLLSESGAILASLFFVLSPLTIRIANSLQPEGLMLFALVLAVYGFIRWLDEDKTKWFVLAMLATAVAVLAKVNSLHIGILFLILLINKKGFAFIRDFRMWLFALVALAPAALWYVHAHQLWLTFGNSLGVSNEYHWAGLDLFTDPRMILGVLKIEMLFVWMPLGVVVAAFAFKDREYRRSVLIAVYWLISVFIYYLAAARTTGDDWAIYYHVVSVPAEALLLGTGFSALQRLFGNAKMLYLSLLGVLGISLFIILLREFADVLFPMPKAASIAVVCAGGFALLAVLAGRAANHRRLFSVNGAVTFFVLFALFSTFLFQSFRISKDMHPQTMQGKYRCALAFKSFIPQDALIVVSGGNRLDESGYPVAYNAPYMFYWLERKGFNIAREDQSVTMLKKLVALGADYFVAEKEMLAFAPQFRSALLQNFNLIKECDEAYLFYLHNGVAE